VAETIEEYCDSLLKRRWFKIKKDLEEQGGLAGVIINLFSVDALGYSGLTKKGTEFYITCIPDTFLIVSMSQEEQALVEAFARVVKYRPFCRYVHKYGAITFEWDKNDPGGRFAKLQEEGVAELQRL